jgi:hypothetical protein
MKKFRIKPKQLLLVGVFILAFFLLMDFFTRLTELSRLSNQRDQARYEITALKSTVLALQTQIAYVTQPVAVEAWARDEAHMAREGDVLIIPVAPASTSGQPIEFSIQTIEPAAKWEVWWSLFWGD